jgi:branched-subunit amino acid transport protein
MRDTPLLLAGLGILAAGTYGFRWAGPALRSRLTVPKRFTKLLDTAAVTLLAALVAVTGLSEGHHEIASYARLGGVLVAGVLAWRKAPFIVIVLAGAATAALLRLMGVP